MTREDTKKLIRMMMATYSNYNPENISETVDAWAFLLEEYPKEVIGSAFRVYVNTSKSGFAPSINDLIAIVNKPVEMAFLDEVSAWSLVSNALRRSAYYAEEEFRKLPPEVQKALGSPTMLRAWSLDEEFNEDVAMSNFLKTYRVVVEREKDTLKTNPQKVLELCGNEVSRIGNHDKNLPGVQ